MKTRVLLVHNNYQLAGGESQAVREEHALFEKNGHPVFLYTRDNDEVNTFNGLQKVTFFLSSLFSWRTYREVRALVREFKPDVAHVHNVFPLITPSVYWALKHEGVPIVQTIHNFRFMCPNGLFFRNQKPCEL
ncbi:MAG: glycosyltransferase, partial [Anaerolineae bacterium]|nr:glycosyltransferase [Anaerolineae bacterium]